jgi:hypothetical protein
MGFIETSCTEEGSLVGTTEEVDDGVYGAHIWMSRFLS